MQYGSMHGHRLLILSMRHELMFRFPEEFNTALNLPRNFAQ